jgi:hypothetical protein
MEYLVNESSPITAVRRVLGFLKLIGIVILLRQVAGVDVDAKPQVAKPQVAHAKPQVAHAKPQVAHAKPQDAKPQVAKPVVIRSTKIYSINPYKLCAILADNLYLF